MVLAAKPLLCAWPLLVGLTLSACAGAQASSQDAATPQEASTSAPVRAPKPITTTEPDDQPAQTPLRADAPRATQEQLEQLVQDQLRHLRAHDERALTSSLLSDRALTTACGRDPDEEPLAQQKQEQFAQSDLASCHHIDWTKTSVLYWRGGQPLQPHYDCPQASTLHADIEVHLSLLDEPDELLVVTLQSPTLLYTTKQLSLELPPRCATIKRQSIQPPPASPPAQAP